MATRTTPPVAAYIAKFPPDTRSVLKKLRAIVRKTLPRATESISYGIPVYKIDGQAVIYIAGWKRHYSIYPANRRLITRFRKELAPYETSGKGTIRFPLQEPIPAKLIAAIARFRATDVTGERGPHAISAE